MKQCWSIVRCRGRLARQYLQEILKGELCQAKSLDSIGNQVFILSKISIFIMFLTNH